MVSFKKSGVYKKKKSFRQTVTIRLPADLNQVRGDFRYGEGVHVCEDEDGDEQ